MADTARLPEAQRRALDRLTSVPRMADLHLDRGTAVAIHPGHRVSLDLAFFRVRPDVDLGAVRDSVRHAFAEADLYQVLRAPTWFEDAEREPAYPAGLTEAAWRDIQAFFVREAPRLMAADPG